MKYGYDIYIEARQHRKEALYSKPLIVSEYGDWEYFAMNAGFEQERWSDMLPEERFSRQARGSGEVRLLQQATNVQEAHNDNLSTHAFADGYWAMFDYSRGLLPTSNFREPRMFSACPNTPPGSSAASAMRMKVHHSPNRWSLSLRNGNPASVAEYAYSVTAKRWNSPSTAVPSAVGPLIRIQ